MTEDDSGFTLIELLLSMTILVIILASITGALVTFLKNGEYTTHRDDHSGGSIIATSYLDRDLASAETFTSFTPANCSTATAILTLQWQEYTATAADPTPRQNGTAYTAKYVVEPDPTSSGLLPKCELRRTYTSGATYAGAQTTLSSSVLVPLIDAGSLTVLSTGTTCSSGSNIKVTLAAYRSDLTPSYSHYGCLKARLQ
jgi:prepilin-type N-terminal cleavage/methylation domain-containing protein